MSSDLDLDELLGKTPPAGTRGLGLDPETARARRLEITRRQTDAQRLAAKALRNAYPEAYKHLMRQARQRIDTERGPLPGD